MAMGTKAPDAAPPTHTACDAPSHVVTPEISNLHKHAGAHALPCTRQLPADLRDGAEGIHPVWAAELGLFSSRAGHGSCAARDPTQPPARRHSWRIAESSNVTEPMRIPRKWTSDGDDDAWWPRGPSASELSPSGLLHVLGRGAEWRRIGTSPLAAATVVLDGPDAIFGDLDDDGAVSAAWSGRD
mmetsp:Transcript_25553/g.79696  ORF Transcript_25553/g.79696 Transcript_25553/m.79696 type:complete len:185 (+) Transcript_25553:197-751(+)